LDATSSPKFKEAARRFVYSLLLSCEYFMPAPAPALRPLHAFIFIIPHFESDIVPRMVLTLPTPPRMWTRIWVQSGNPLPEYDAPGFDESCKYIEYKPNQRFVIMIDSQPAQGPKSYLGFFVEIDGKELSYFFISGPKGFKKGTPTFPIRGDFGGGDTKNCTIPFKFPQGASLGQILVKVFNMTPFENVSPSTHNLDFFEKKGEIRNVHCYQSVR
jgi:hypothetical protein